MVREPWVGRDILHSLAVSAFSQAGPDWSPTGTAGVWNMFVVMVLLTSMWLQGMILGAHWYCKANPVNLGGLGPKFRRFKLCLIVFMGEGGTV